MGVKIKAILGLLCLLLFVTAQAADSGTIELTAFPSAVVADGRSPITISALVRDSQGRLVANGTQVVFEAVNGAFRESVITTENGYARASLTANLPGAVRIRATALRYNASGTIEIEAVSDRSMLSSAKEYIEVTASSSLLYSINERIIEANGKEPPVSLRYRDVEITAEDMQIRVPTAEVRARRAKLTIGRFTQYFEELHFRLRFKTGIGITEHEVEEVVLENAGLLIAPTKRKRSRYGPVVVTFNGIKPAEPGFDQRLLKFQDISDSVSTVEAKKAVAYPAKEIYFYRSNVKVSGTSIMKLPLFQVNTQTQSPLVTEQFVNISNNNLALNYPYYLSLKPGETSLLRFRHGTRFGGGAGAGGGSFLDFEWKWNRGDEMDGGMTLYGLNRSDWGANIRQYYQADSRTTFTAQLDFPSHKSVYGSINANRLFDGFQVGFNTFHSQSLAGAQKFRSEQVNVTAEKDPVNIPGLGRLFFGLNGTSQRISGGTVRSQDTLGLQARLSTKTFRIDRSNSVNANFRLGQNMGNGSRQGFTQLATVSVSSQLSPQVGFLTTYDFVNDGFNSEFLGRHRLTSEAFYGSQRMSIRGSVSKSLDLDRANASANFSYSMGPAWKFYYAYTWDRYLADAFLDQTYIVGYTIGFREIGLSYSVRRQRLGLELLGTRF